MFRHWLGFVLVRSQNFDISPSNNVVSPALAVGAVTVHSVNMMEIQLFAGNLNAAVPWYIM
jgi:hypothetical protein